VSMCLDEFTNATEVFAARSSGPHRSVPCSRDHSSSVHSVAHSAILAGLTSRS
jgi:hypothetical protein